MWGNLHRDKAIFASRRNGAPSGLGIIRAKVDELSQIFLIQDVLQRDWECVSRKTLRALVGGAAGYRQNLCR